MKKLIAILIFASFTNIAMAAWVGPGTVKDFNPGGNSTFATYISLNGINFSGCTGSYAAVVLGENPNYKEIVATLLLAKATTANIKVNISGCSGPYSIITEVNLL